MMLVTMAAALLQAAQPAPPAAEGPAPAWRTAGQAWGTCVKGRIDARLRSTDPAEALVDGALGGCATQENAVRTAIAAERGAEAAAANIERMRAGGRAMFLAYVARERGQAPAAAAPPATPSAPAQ